MKQLTRSQSVKWCRSNGLHTPEMVQDLCLNRFAMPQAEAERVKQSAALMDHLGARQVLVFVAAWGIWRSLDRWDLYEEFCKRHACKADLAVFPGYRFQSHEIAQAKELVAIGAACLWDIYIIGAKGKRWLYFSHDEIGGASFANEDAIRPVHHRSK